MNKVINFDIKKVGYDSFESAMEAAAKYSGQTDKQMLIYADDQGKYHIAPTDMKITIIGMEEKK